MPIDENLSILSSVLLSFQEPRKSRLNRAIDSIRGALHVFNRPREVVFSFNGGKDSTLVLHLLRLVLQSTPSGGHKRSFGEEDVRIVYFEPPPESPNFDEVLSFISKTEELLGIRIDTLRGGFKAGMTELINQGARCVIVGTRRTDPDGRYLDGEFCPTSLNWPPMMRVCPALDLTYSDVWAVLRGANLPFCSMYSDGYTSIGSIHDTKKNPSLLIPLVSDNVEENNKEQESVYALDKDAGEEAVRGMVSITQSVGSSLSTLTIEKQQMAIFISEATDGKRTHLPAWFLDSDDLERLGRK
jgi:3'-phosphoadenosine 5'-phosphosulfate sulfotransferase (PAPS reductase)/FAD synthetase